MSGNTYSTETWSIIEGLYESGRFSSIKELHSHCTKTLKRTPSIDAIKKRFGKKNLDKGKTAEERKETERRKYAEIFEELGVGRVETAKIIQQGILAGPTLFAEALKKIQEAGPVSEEALASLRELYSGWGTTYKFIRERNKLTGDYAAQKVQHSGKIQTGSPEDDMSREEIEKELERIEKQRKSETDK